MIVSISLCSAFGKRSVSALDIAHNGSEKTQSTPEDLHHEDLHKRIRVLGVCDGASRPRDTNANTESSKEYPQKRLLKPTEMPVQKRA